MLEDPESTPNSSLGAEQEALLALQLWSWFVTSVGTDEFENSECRFETGCESTFKWRLSADPLKKLNENK